MIADDAASPSPIDVDGGTPDDRSATLYVGLSVEQEAIERALFAAAAAQRATQGADPLASFGRRLLELAAQAQGQLFQDVFALFFNDDKQDGIFVEVGTGDGKVISNTYMLEKTFGWSGLVVEPNPVFASQLRAHRNCRISHDCVLDVTGRRVVFQCLEEPEFSGIALNGSLVAEDIHLAKRAENVRNLAMTTISLNQLLEREAVPAPIDFLSVDVEGSEFAILRTFDFGKWRPRCLTIEHNWHRSRADIHDLMRSQGYVRVFPELSQWDDWFVDRHYLASRPEWRTVLADMTGPTPNQQAQILLAAAQEAIARGALIVAASLCAASLAHDPTIGATYRTLADIAQREGRQVDAIGFWEQAIATDVDDYWARIGLADLIEVRGEIDRAGLVLQEARFLARKAEDDRAIATIETLLTRFGTSTAPPADPKPKRRSHASRSITRKPRT